MYITVTVGRDSSFMKALEAVPNALLLQLARAIRQ